MCWRNLERSDGGQSGSSCETAAVTNQDLPRFDFDASPRTERCQRCGSAADDGADLRFVILRGRDRYVGRTLCDVCVEEALEVVVADCADAS
jgi:uncharacterized protein YjbI with pentapeptide repeats